MRKRIKNILLFVFPIVLIVLLLRKRAPVMLEQNGNCIIPAPRLQSGQAETNPRAALYYNNTHGLIKTANLWTSLGEVANPNTPYKAFRTLRDGIKANLYNLLYYIYVLRIRNVGDIIARWVGTSKNTLTYKNYLATTGFSEACELNTKEKIRIFFTNQAIAENHKNNTIYIYTIFNELYEELKSLIPNLP